MTLFDDGDHVLPREDADAAADRAAGAGRATASASSCVDGAAHRRGSSAASEREGAWTSPREAAATSAPSAVDEILVAWAGRRTSKGSASRPPASRYDARAASSVDDACAPATRASTPPATSASRCKFTHAADAAGADRRPERALLRPQEGARRPGDAVVHLHQPGDRPRRTLRRRGRAAPGRGGRHVHRAAARTSTAPCSTATEGFVRVHLKNGSDTHRGRHPGGRRTPAR